MLISCTMFALLLANSPLARYYHAVLEMHFFIGIGGLSISKTLLHWINDSLMTLFFLLVGLEIKRELMIGQLSSRQKATLPIMSAIGGMLLPALIYTICNYGSDTIRGWAIPTATDIAFAIGVLNLLGSIVPVNIKIFLTALAIVDDLGAVVIIAVVYTSNISVYFLLAATGVFAVLMLLNVMGSRNLWIYCLIGIVLWFFTLKSGIHATIAGVVLAATIPGNFKSKKSAGELFLEDEPEREDDESQHHMTDSPLLNMEHGLYHIVTYGIMPLFAFANAGISLRIGTGDLINPAVVGVFLGLVLGKQLGVISFAWLSVRTKLAELPVGVSWGQLYGVAWLSGIGFTMSIFIDLLVFGESKLADTVKLSILAASFFAGAGGWLVLKASYKPPSD